MDFCELEASLIYRDSSNTGSKAIQRNPVSKQKNKQKIFLISNPKQKALYIHALFQGTFTFPGAYAQTPWGLLAMNDAG